jgi:hypothetical protein
MLAGDTIENLRGEEAVEIVLRAVVGIVTIWKQRKMRKQFLFFFLTDIGS